MFQTSPGFSYIKLASKAVNGWVVGLGLMLGGVCHCRRWQWWVLASGWPSLGLLGLVNIGDMAAVSCLVWCSGSERGGDRGVTHLGCMQWGLVTVVGGDAGAGQ